MKKLLFTIAAAVLMAGCTIVNEGGLPVGKNLIQASSKDDTRTVMVQDGDEFCHNWVKGDAFALMDGTNFIKYELVGEGGSTNEVFTGDAPVGPGPYYVYYPYKDVFMDIYTDATIKSTFTWVFPKEVEFEGGNIAGEDAMIGLSVDGKTVSMKNMCGYVRLNIFTPSVSFLDELEIIAPGGEGIAGPYHVDLTPEGIPELTPMNGYNNERLSNKVTVKFPSKTMTIAGTELFIPLPAVELSQGLVFVLKGNFDGEPEIRLTSSTATLERNIVLVMPDYRMPSEEAKIGDVVYGTVGEAFAAAKESDGPCTITLLRNCMASDPFTMLESDANDDITLDLNGHILYTSVPEFIKIYSGNFVITDSQDKVGKLSSTSSKVIRTTRVDNTKVNLTISNCIIEGTTYEASSWSANNLVQIGGTTTATITGSRLYTTKKLTVLRLNDPTVTVTIDDTEITSGTEGTGYNGIYVYTGTLVFNSGSIYVKGSSTNRPAIGLEAIVDSKAIINNGYFYSEAGNGWTLRKPKSNYAVMTINCGYMNNQPSNGGGSAINYNGELKTLEIPETYVHQTTGTTLSYGYVVE